MAVLIKGMEMPLPGTFNIIYIYSDGQVHMPSWGKGMTPTNGVKAIPIPSHGRLIDADALIKQVKRDGIRSDPFVRIVCDYFKDAPTVIPASEEG